MVGVGGTTLLAPPHEFGKERYSTACACGTVSVVQIATMGSDDQGRRAPDNHAGHRRL